MIRESDGPSYRGKRFLWIRRKDICTREGDVYLTRWTLARLFGWALLLHVMRRPDQDRCHHDHPWPFFTLVLRGGYREQITDLTTGAVRERFNRPGALLYRPAIHTHRVADLPQGSCTTLVLRGPRRRVWGFRNPDGRWRPWDAFVDWAGTVLWCDEREPEGGADDEYDVPAWEDEPVKVTKVWEPDEVFSLCYPDGIEGPMPEGAEIDHHTKTVRAPARAWVAIARNGDLLGSSVY